MVPTLITLNAGEDVETRVVHLLLVELQISCHLERQFSGFFKN